MKKTSIIALLIIIFDRIIKILVSKYMVIDEKISIIKDNLYIYNCHNTGAAFSLFDNSTFILMLLSIIALFFIIYYISINIIIFWKKSLISSEAFLLHSSLFLLIK